MPRIGLLSDSHGRARPTRRAVELLLSHGAEVLLHLGDVGSTGVIDALAVTDPASGTQIEAHLVFGNTDWDTAALARYARDLDVAVDHPAGRLALPEGALVFCHGHEREPMQQAIRDHARYLCHGHTHQASDTRDGATRIINPGALHRARQYTVALLDTESDALAFYPVPSA
ncbi:MAG: metallophosphoesterase family protein [Phycisphaeraceae bacterium]